MRIYDKYVKKDNKTVVFTDNIQKYLSSTRCHQCGRSIKNSNYLYIDDKINKRFRNVRYYHIDCSYKHYKLITKDDMYALCYACHARINKDAIVIFVRSTRRYYHKWCYE